jgi:hypothetical protein
MVLPHLLLSVSLFVASLATPLKRTVAQVEADIANITSQVNVWDERINGFPSSGLVGALVSFAAAFPSTFFSRSAVQAIHNATGGLGTSLTTSTTDIKVLTFP